jgi:hypothetical protein
LPVCLRYLQARFTSGDNIIVDLTNVDLGCSGTWNNVPWNANQCGITEIFGWMEAAKQHTLNVRLDVQFTFHVAEAHASFTVCCELLAAPLHPWHLLCCTGTGDRLQQILSLGSHFARLTMPMGRFCIRWLWQQLPHLDKGRRIHHRPVLPLP